MRAFRRRKKTKWLIQRTSCFTDLNRQTREKFSFVKTKKKRVCLSSIISSFSNNKYQRKSPPQGKTKKLLFVFVFVVKQESDRVRLCRKQDASTIIPRILKDSEKELTIVPSNHYYLDHHREGPLPSKQQISQSRETRNTLLFVVDYPQLLLPADFRITLCTGKVYFTIKITMQTPQKKENLSGCGARSTISPPNNYDGISIYCKQ